MVLRVEAVAHRVVESSREYRFDAEGDASCRLEVVEVHRDIPMLRGFALVPEDDLLRQGGEVLDATLDPDGEAAPLVPKNRAVMFAQ